MNIAQHLHNRLQKNCSELARVREKRTETESKLSSLKAEEAALMAVVRELEQIVSNFKVGDEGGSIQPGDAERHGHANGISRIYSPPSELLDYRNDGPLAEARRFLKKHPGKQHIDAVLQSVRERFPQTDKERLFKSMHRDAAKKRTICHHGKGMFSLIETVQAERMDS